MFASLAPSHSQIQLKSSFLPKAMEGTGWKLFMWRRRSSNTMAREADTKGRLWLGGIVKAAVTQMPGLQEQAETDPVLSSVQSAEAAFQFFKFLPWISSPSFCIFLFTLSSTPLLRFHHFCCVIHSLTLFLLLLFWIFFFLILYILNVWNGSKCVTCTWTFLQGSVRSQVEVFRSSGEICIHYWQSQR